MHPVGAPAFGFPPTQQPHHRVPAGATPLARLDPAQRDRRVEHAFQGIEIALGPGA
jgi:hypothetical protein